MVAGVTQELRDTLVGLRRSGDHDRLPILLDGRQVDALGRLLDQFVEQVDRHVAIGLKIFHSALAGLEGLDFSLERGDVLDLGVELAVGLSQKIVACLLPADHLLLEAVPQPDHHSPNGHGCTQACEKSLLAQLPFFLTVRQKVDQNHARNLRMAKPQAVR